MVDRPREIIPSPYGARNWHPMSFNPQTGLAYMPVQGVPVNLMDNKNWKMGGNTPGEPHGGLGWNLAMYANVEPPEEQALRPPRSRGIRCKQKEAWRQEHVSPWNGGTLTTAGNLVFQGTADGRFVAYNATTGDKLWETADGHRRGRGAGHLPRGRDAVRVGGGGLGRRVRRHASRHQPAGAGHRLHLRHRQRTAGAGVRRVPAGRRWSRASSTIPPTCRKARCSTSATACSATASPGWTAAAT